MIVVKTQQELDAALAADAASVIVIDAPRGVWLSLSHSGNATVEAWDNSTVEARGDAAVRAWDNATVRASGNVTVEARGDAAVRARDNVTVRASGNSTVEAWGNVTAWASGNSTVRASGNAAVQAWGNSTVEAWGNATVEAWDNSTVEARGDAAVRASGNSTVEARGNAAVRASGNSTVEARGNAAVRAWDNAIVRASGNAAVEASGNVTVEARDNVTVRAASHVAVHLHSASARVDGGVVIDVTAVHDHVESWLAYRGIDVADGTAIVYKYVRGNYGSHHGVTYAIGETVESADWEPSRTCGHGLHFGATPTEARQYGADRHDPGDERWLACEIDVADAVVVGGNKIKAKACRVLHEVTLDGERVEEAS